MTELTFPPPVKRFLKEEIDPHDWSQLKTVFDQLEQREIQSVSELEDWLKDISELDSLLDGTIARLYIDTSCHTDDEEATEKYMEFQRSIIPEAKLALDRLDRKFLDSPYRKELNSERYALLEKIKVCDSELFREENLPLETEEKEHSQRYSQITGGMTIELDGEEITFPQASLELEKQDRDHRERVWRLIVERRLKDTDEIESLFDKMFELRVQRAKNAGLSDYRAFRFKDFHRFDYGVAECESFHQGVQKTVVPALKTINENRARRLGIDRLRPWDYEVNPYSDEPIRPFDSEPKLIDLARTIFNEVDPHFAHEFTALEKAKYLDLFSRPNKAPGGYQYFIEDVRLPFIFANAAGKHEDLQVLLHEGGHAFHSLACRDEPLILYRSASLEFCEVAAMGFEFLGLEHIDTIYTPEEAAQVKAAHFEKVLRLLTWIASVDSFQHWIYTTDDASAEARRDEWVRIRSTYGSPDEWEGLEEIQRTQWHRQGHIFKQPFYYIEYGIAMLGALQLWSHYRQDRKKTVEQYRYALSLGGTQPLSKLFEAAGLKFDFSEKLQAPLVQLVLEELDRLDKEIG